MLPWEGVELFDTGDGGVLEAIGLTVFVEGSVDLTGTDDYSVNFVMVDDEFSVFWVWDDPAEVGVAKKIVDVGAAEWVSKEGFGEEDAKCWNALVSVSTSSEATAGLTFSELSVHLSSKNVEQICWSGHVCNLHVTILMLAVELVCRWEDSRLFVAKL